VKILDALLYLLCLAGALAGYFVLAPPLSFAVISLCLAFAAWTVFASQDSGKTVLRLAGLSWSMEDFVRGWLITGRTGSGKTLCAINTITYQIFRNVPHWGGVCLDQKGLYWEILVRMAAHFGREEDLTLLQTRPLGKDMLWRPVHTINITGNPNVPASTYAKVIVDTAVSLTGGRGQSLNAAKRSAPTSNSSSIRKSPRCSARMSRRSRWIKSTPEKLFASRCHRSFKPNGFTSTRS
jgi:hypothetical protein